MNARNIAPTSFPYFMCLPDHIQEKIISSCDSTRTQLSMTETCRSIHQLFFTTPRLTRQLKLVMKFTRDNGDTVIKLSTLLSNVSMGRKYSKVKLVHVSDVVSSAMRPLLLRILSLMGASVKELEISSGNYVMRDISSLLRCFKSVEKIVLTNVQSDDDGNDEGSSIESSNELPKMKELILQDSKSTLVKIFRNFTHLEKFKFHCNAREAGNIVFREEKLENFILSQHRLKGLDLSRMHENLLFSQTPFDFEDLPLESLSANKFFIHKSNSQNFFEKLQNLKSLKLYDFHDTRVFPDDSDYSRLLRTILSLPKLESVGIFSCTVKIEDFKHLTPVRNNSVKFLEYDMWSSQVFEKMLEIFPKLEKIFLRCFTVKLREVPVEKLAIMHTSGSYSFEEFIYQPNLLDVNRQIFEDNLRKFISRHRNIKNLAIGHSSWIENNIQLSLNFWIETLYHLSDLIELVVYNPAEVRTMIMILSLRGQNFTRVTLLMKESQRQEIVGLRIPTWCKILTA